MVHIISKKDGPRREDVAAMRLIKENRSTIEALANRFSGGRYSEMRKPPKPPQIEGLVQHYMGATKVAETERPAYVRVSLNGRVVIVDGDTSKQLHFLGEIRSRDGGQEFVLATRKNKFFSPMDDDLSEKLADFDHSTINADFSEEDLAIGIHEKLELE